MKKISLCLVIVLCLMLVITSCANSPEASNAQEVPKTTDTKEEKGTKDVIKIKLGGTVAMEHPITKSLLKFEELLEEKTNGAVDVTVYPNLQLGGAREMFEAVQLGNLEMVESGSMVLGGFTDKFKFMNMPYLFNSREAAFDFIYSETGKQLTKSIAEETGLYAVGYVENGFFQLTNNTKPIVVPEDLNGMKFRVQESDIYLKVHALLGANPTPMSFTELFTALQQGVVEGQSNSYVLIETSRLYEVQKYLTDLKYFYDLTGIYINKEFFDELEPDIQKAILDSMREASDYQVNLVVELEQEAIKKLEGLMEVTHLTDEQRKAFIDKTKPAYDWFREEYKDPNFDKYLEEIAAINAKYEN